MGLQELLSNYDDCPDMKIWIQERLLAGSQIQMQKRDKQLKTEIYTQAVRGQSGSSKIKLWSNQGVWKVQVGISYRTSMPICYVQTKTLEEAFSYFKNWYENPPPRRG